MTSQSRRRALQSFTSLLTSTEFMPTVGPLLHLGDLPADVATARATGIGVEKRYGDCRSNQYLR